MMWDMENPTPVRIPEAPPSYARRTDWAAYADGSWWEMWKVPDGVDTFDTFRACRIRAAARKWAYRNGYGVESHMPRGGRYLALRFVKEAS
jgi:hypothetical protein